MNIVEQRIKEEGKILVDHVLCVDGFLNHQIDVSMFKEIGALFAQRFANVPVDKIVTIESSGIAVATMCSLFFNEVPVVFAKKQASKNLDGSSFLAKVISYTKGTESYIRINKKLLSADDHVLIVDDFLANGQAALGLVSLVEQAGAVVEGIGVVIEKSFQPGRTLLEKKGHRVEALARIKEMSHGKVTFVDG